MSIDGASPWLALAGLGAFHGLNPATGWLFAVALGLHAGRRSVVYLSLIPIVAGHALSIAAIAIAVAMLGLIVEVRVIEVLAGLALICWAVLHGIFGHRGHGTSWLATGMLGLFGWSFVMAASHGAGLMLVPIVLPLCLAETPAHRLLANSSLPIALAAVGVHMTAMAVITALAAAFAYELHRAGALRRRWLNPDALWTAALVIAGLILLS
jgi:hypothetical protein